jgi:Ca2+-binding RTX toxin-like protein
VTTVRALFTAAAIGLAAFVLAQALTAFTASASVPSTRLGSVTSSVTANDLKPSECTMTVTSVARGSGTFAATAPSQLVLGSSGNDTITGNSGGNDCIVGGAGTDTITGLGTGNECIVSSSTTVVVDCTVVAVRP